MTREKFGSRLGFLLVSAGCAIGIGNVWKFPYVTGENGGGIFVLFYLLFLMIMGLPVLTMELAVGRASRKSAVLAYQTLEKPGSFWHLHGWVAIAGCYLLMMYYTTVSGWMVSYFVKFLTGTFSGVLVEETAGVFNTMMANPAEMTAFMALTVCAGFLVCSLGLQNGIERITKVMMTGLLVLIIVLAVHCLGLPDAMKGVAFYLKPDPAEAARVGLFNVMTAAMSQAFFTLSLGVASMEIFGSYMSKDNTLMQESLWICVLDTFVALVSGLIIFPACFSFGVQPDAGPDLIFITLPKVFMSMTGGRLWGTLFFLFMTFASFSTVIAVFENLISCCIDNFGWSRKKAVTINLLFMLAASMPCVLGFNIWSGWNPIKGMNVLGSEDFIVSNLLLPVGALIYLLFCTTKWGWGFDNYIAEANTGSGMKMPVWLKGYFQWILPLLIIGIFVSGLL
ncbi:MAG: sodium-dependent transporter [Erysipelotrichaceae bacterium]|nr:sodium-dependent transporter [Erysipelotrichaceae bacterium]